MNLKKCTLEHMDLEYLMTELRFNIAAARAEKADLVLFELATEDERSRRRRYTSVLFRLRQLKREGTIGFLPPRRILLTAQRRLIIYLINIPQLPR